MEIPQPCGCTERPLHRAGCMAGPQSEIQEIWVQDRQKALRVMSPEDVLERDALNRTVTSEALRTRALVGRGSLNGHLIKY
jgi:hypothetical protein